ncbi:MAG: PQQ-binding-like beta-propeller repeat protein [Pirellulaceae bacterium]|nr:PQQ-binding-like beta-propeller repeat protein [Pirellulaceae bacterium]
MKVQPHPAYLVALGTIVWGLAYMGTARGEDKSSVRWPQFRGPDAAGRAEEGTYPVEFGLNKNLLWSAELPRGVSSPCVWDDRIYLTGCLEDTREMVTVCLDRESGRELWRRSVVAEKIEKMNAVSSPAAGTPVSDGQRVYVYFGSYGLVCYSCDGKQLWEYRLPIPRTFEGSGTSAILVGERLILKRDQLAQRGRPSFLLALDRQSGDVAWRTDRDIVIPGASTPVYWPHDGLDELIVASSGELIGYDPSDGTERWRVEGLPRTVNATPVVAAGHVFFVGSDLHGVPENVAIPPPFEEFVKKYDKDDDDLVSREEITEDLVIIDRHSDGAGDKTLLNWFFRGTDQNKDQKLDDAEWRGLLRRVRRTGERLQSGAYAVRLGGEGDVTETHVIWQQQRGVPEVPSPLYYDGRIYYVSNGGIIFCRDARGGDELFKGRLGVAGGYYASPVVGDGRIYIAAERGAIIVIEAGEKLKLLATNDLGEPLMATPALVDGKIYVRSNSRLHAFGL